MPRRVTPKRERQYKNIARKAKKEGRYERQEEEVAARVVNKQRAKSRATPFVDVLIPALPRILFHVKYVLRCHNSVVIFCYWQAAELLDIWKAIFLLERPGTTRAIN
jgi:hypothetical protein